MTLATRAVRRPGGGAGGASALSVEGWTAASASGGSGANALSSSSEEEAVQPRARIGTTAATRAAAVRRERDCAALSDMSSEVRP
jgi:hypothetical protein